MANTGVTYAYAADIIKAEKTDDGDLLVFGKAAGPEVDLDGQICDPDWLQRAMPDWAKWGNVRAQHSAIAAGVGVELEDIGGGSWTLKSLVVDEDSKRKVEKKVYKGYSIGVKGAHVVKDAKAPKGRIVSGEIVEISLVDRPANPTATMTLCKVAGGVPAPVDEHGIALPDLIKAAKATVSDVLYGDLLADLDDAGDAAGAVAALAQVCDLIIHEAALIKSAAADGEVSMEGLQDAVSALTEFADTDDDGSDVDGPEYDGIEDDAAAYTAQLEQAEDELVEKMLQRAKADGYLVKAATVDGDSGAELVPATLVEAEITKAVAKATGPLEAELETLRAKVAEAMAAPMPGGPVLIAPVKADVTKASEADRLLAIASNPTVSPEVRALYGRVAAEREGAAA